MRLKKVSTILIFFILIIMQINFVYAADQYKAFRSCVFAIGDCSPEIVGYVDTSIKWGVATFNKLGYSNAGGNSTAVSNVNNKQDVLNWIRQSSNNYGFYIYAHGTKDWIEVVQGDSSTYLYPSEISGNWHLVFLNCCSCNATNAFATKFHTDGYSKRATLGWYMDVEHKASAEWWPKFYNLAGNTDLRTACLNAADQCSNKTPIRIYGDKTWNGKSW